MPDPRLSTIDRYVRALGARLILQQPVSTLYATAEAITAALETPEDAFRLAVQFIDDITDLNPTDRCAASGMSRNRREFLLRELLG